MRRLDAHQHFWIYEAAQYPWMGPEHDAIRRDFLAADLVPHLNEIGFDASVAVQARQTPEETRWLLALAEGNDRIAGVVGWVDLCSPSIPAQLDEFAGSRKLVGVRHVVHDEPDDEFMLRDDFQRGISALGSVGLTYDLLVFPRHLSAAMTLVDRFPYQQFVVDHIAKPDIAGGVLDPWAGRIRELARRENVFCKLSGLVTEADHATWKPSDFEPYIETVLEAFGPSRLMIGSDWPVCTLAGTYESVMRLALEAIRGLAAEEQDAICGGTCARFYRLESGDGAGGRNRRR
jgi:L-fuconolactonase